MLEIVRSGFSSGAREAFSKEILGLAKKGSRSILIVPEQQTVMGYPESIVMPRKNHS